MPEHDEQLEQPNTGDAELSFHGELSDEELLAMDADGTLYQTPAVEPEALQPEQPQAEVIAEEPAVDETGVEQPKGNAQPVGTTEVEAEVNPTATATVPDVTANPEPTQTPEAQPDTTDYKAFHSAITAKFKANGREVQVKSADDAIALMQQGANYAKKMEAIKPALQVHRTLEKAELLDPEKIGFMIDLYHGKPEAIAKLAQDRGIDLYNLGETKAEDYQPSSPMVSAQEVDLNSTIRDLSAQPSFEHTFNTLSGWDMQSQQRIMENPRLLGFYQEHKENGIFDQIVNAIASERMFGRLLNVADDQAYQLVGDQLFGQPKHQPQAPVQTAAPVTIPVIETKPVVQPAAQAAELEKKRVAAAAPRSNQTQAHTDFNPLAISDDELEKLIASNTRLY